MDFDTALNESFLVISIISTLLFGVSELLGYFSLKHKSLTSLVCSLCCGKCAKRHIEQRETLEREQKLKNQVQEEIRLEELREIMVPKTSGTLKSSSGSIEHKPSSGSIDPNTPLVSIVSSRKDSTASSLDFYDRYLDDHRSYGRQNSIILNGDFNAPNSLFYVKPHPQITIEAATPYPRDSPDPPPFLRRPFSMRSHSDPLHMSSGRVILLSPTASSLLPLLLSQNDASDNAEDSGT